MNIKNTVLKLAIGVSSAIVPATGFAADSTIKIDNSSHYVVKVEQFGSQSEKANVKISDTTGSTKLKNQITVLQRGSTSTVKLNANAILNDAGEGDKIAIKQLDRENSAGNFNAFAEINNGGGGNEINITQKNSSKKITASADIDQLDRETGIVDNPYDLVLGDNKINITQEMVTGTEPTGIDAMASATIGISRDVDVTIFQYDSISPTAHVEVFLGIDSSVSSHQTRLASKSKQDIKLRNSNDTKITANQDLGGGDDATISAKLVANSTLDLNQWYGSNKAKITLEDVRETKYEIDQSFGGDTTIESTEEKNSLVTISQWGLGSVASYTSTNTSDGNVTVTQGGLLSTFGNDF